MQFEMIRLAKDGTGEMERYVRSVEGQESGQGVIPGGAGIHGPPNFWPTTFS